MRPSTGLLTVTVCLCAVLTGGCGSRDGTEHAEASFVVELELDEVSVPDAELERGRIALAHALSSAGVAFASLATGESSVLVGGIDPSELEQARGAADLTLTGWVVETEPAGSLRVSLPADVGPLVERARTRTLEVLRSRLRGLGVRAGPFEPTGDADTFRVRISGGVAAGTVTEVLAAPTTLRWYEIRLPPAVEDPAAWIAPDSEEKLLEMFDGNLPPNTRAIPQTLTGPDGAAVGTAYWPVSEIPVLTGNDIVRTQVGEDKQGKPAIAFELSEEAATRFERVTSENVGRRMAIVLRDRLGDRVRSAPVIRAPISGQGVIAGGFTTAETRGLSIVLASGELPGRLKVSATERD